MRILFLSVALILITPVSAEVYRSIDEDGNVVFTDKPSPDAEKIRIDKVQTISAPKVEEFKYSPPEKAVDSVYTNLKIVNPVNEQVITGGAGNVTVTVQIDPALDSSDRLVFFMDGKKQEDSSSSSYSFTNLDRGTHTTKVSVVSEDGKSLKSSAPVTFSVNRPSVRNRN